jgi:WD40 repeat protein
MEMRNQTTSPACPTSVAKLVSSLKGHADAVESLAFTPDRRLLASGGRDGTGRIWDVGSSKPGERAAFRKSGEGFRSLAFSPNSRLLAAGSAAGQVSLVDVSEKAAQEIRVLRGGQGSIDALAFSPDGKQVAGGGEDQTLRVWEPGAGPGGEARILLPGHSMPIRALTFAPDGQSIASGAQDATARVWALSRIRASQRMSLPHGGEVNAVAYSTDGKTLATAVLGKVIWLWDVTASKPTVRNEFPGHAGGTRLLLFTPEAETMVSVGAESQVINWNLRTGKPRHMWELPAGRALSVALTQDGRYLARGMADGTVEVFRVAEKRT